MFLLCRADENSTALVLALELVLTVHVPLRVARSYWFDF